MKLYEFDSDVSHETILSGVIGMMLNRIKDTGYNNHYSVKTVLDALHKRGMDVDEELFAKMIENPPLSKVVSIKDGELIFKDENDSDLSVDNFSDKESEAEHQANTLEKMAKRATKKR
jgi:hypothetical protein